MRVLFCGTSSGGNNFNPDRAGASLFVEEGATGVSLDCGPGSLERLVRSGRKLQQIDAVFLSHIHHDHVLGLAELVARLIVLDVGGTQR